ncbi:16.9 kDa class I heat shock protein 1-like [Triticum aestivum]|uniref:16.9 kDa class I heat shock protein 1-like n=1 Tax=Triticum aestivum TaxID=4565 RepID=UPI001D00F557|nr:16.9 kDa class I heat shock protein 1-like [Triticum aestivum]
MAGTGSSSSHKKKFEPEAADAARVAKVKRKQDRIVRRLKSDIGISSSSDDDGCDNDPPPIVDTYISVDDRKGEGPARKCTSRSNVFDPFADLWADPFDTFRSIVPAISGNNNETATFANARVDWKEIPEAHVFKADLPGVRKEEVKVEVEDGNVLVVSGERTKEKEDKNDKWHRVERSSGKFVRRFRLPEDAKVEEVKAGLENGVLTVTVPKAEVKKPEVKAIEISG